MQAIVSELALPEEKSLNGLQKALQLAASGNDISLLFSTIYGVRTAALSLSTHCYSPLPSFSVITPLQLAYSRTRSTA